jgi:hypothetical protein
VRQVKRRQAQVKATTSPIHIALQSWYICGTCLYLVYPQVFGSEMLQARSFRLVSIEQFAALSGLSASVEQPMPRTEEE